MRGEGGPGADGGKSWGGGGGVDNGGGRVFFGSTAPYGLNDVRRLRGRGEVRGGGYCGVQPLRTVLHTISMSPKQFL